MEKLLEGGRIAGTLSYKDFIAANSAWTVGLVDGVITSNGVGKVKAISEYLRDDKEAGSESFKRACKTIKDINKEMLNHKLNDLKNVITDYIQLDINSYFGRKQLYNQDTLTPYDVLRVAQAYANKHGGGALWSPNWREELLTKQHQAAYAEAIVYKYFEDMLKDANDRRSGLKRALNNMSNQDKDIAKAWFKDHVTDIYFIVPRVDDENNSNVSITGSDGFEDKEKTTAAINRIINLTNSFKQTYPNAIHQIDYTYRNTSNKADERKKAEPNVRGRKTKEDKKDDARKDLWNWMAFVTFDTKVENIPDNIKTIIADAKRQSMQDTKTMREMSDDYTVCSVPLAQAILSLFDNDFNFYKDKRTSVADGSDELIKDYQ